MNGLQKLARGPLHPALPSRAGAVLVFLVIGIVMLLAMAMITVDVASMQLTRTELRAASDSAAKAGAESLLRTQNLENARTAAMAMAGLNKVAGRSLTLRNSDVVIGKSSLQTDGSWTFTEGGDKPNAVRVNAVLSQGAGTGTFGLVFGKIFGAGSFEPAKSSTASVLEQEVCLTVDRSASMAWDLSGSGWSYPTGGAYDQPPHATLSRWAALAKAVDSYVAIIGSYSPRPRVALVTWASEVPPDDPVAVMWGTTYPVVRLEVPLTGSLAAILTSLANRGSKPLIGSTNMSAGIDEGVRVLTAAGTKAYAKKVLILMTDGQWNQGRSPILAAQDARDAGVIIHVITFLPGAASADTQTVAEITGGRLFHAENEAELIQAFEELARSLPVVLTD